MTAFADIIERLEKATGPDRELDGAIFWFAERSSAMRFYWNASAGKPTEPPDALPASGLGRHAVVHCSPRYTESVDAAVTLAPSPRWFWRVDSHDPSAWVYLNIQDAYKGAGATPAIALSMAALKARTASQREGPK